MDMAAERGYLSVARYLSEHGKRGFTHRGIEGAAANGHLKVIEYLMNRLGDDDDRADEAMKQAVENGQVEIVRYLHERGRPIDREAPKIAALGGHLPVIMYLWAEDGATTSPRCNWTSDVPDAAAQNGHGHVVYWLYAHAPLRCTRRLFPVAARHGNVQLIQLLLDHCSSPIRPLMIQDMMNQAADRNHLELMRFLEAFGADMMTKRAMDGAATHGNLEFVQYLHNHSGGEGCSTKAMDGAAQNGHLMVIEFLHEHRTEGCTSQAMTLAASNGHLSVVQFLHETVGLEITEDAVRGAVQFGRLAVFDYFRNHGAVRPDSWYARSCIHFGHLDLLKYIVANELSTLCPIYLKEQSQQDEYKIFAFVLEKALILASAGIKKSGSGGVHRDEDRTDDPGRWLPDVLKRLVERGKLKYIQLLDSSYNMSKLDYSDAIDTAAREGRLDMLQYFHSRGYLGFSQSTVALAEMDGSESCVRFLSGIRVSSDELAHAIESYSLSAVEFLLLHGNTTVTAGAVAAAERRGDVELLQLLQEHRRRSERNSRAA